MDKVKLLFSKISNFYFIVGFLSLVWMLFFDRYNLMERLETQIRIHELQADLRFFKAERDEIELTRDMLDSDIGELERFAREHFMLKRENEDLFLIAPN